MTSKKQKGSPLARVFSRKPIFSQEVFERLWRQNLTADEIAALFGVTVAVVHSAVAAMKEKELARQAKLEARRQKIAASAACVRMKRQFYDEIESGPKEWEPGEITIEEITERAAEIRAKWTDEERQRRISRVVRRVELQNFVYHARTSSFSAMAST